MTAKPKTDPLRESLKLLRSGQALWDEIADGRELDGPTAAIVIQACRIVDRLDRLDAILRGRSKEWISFVPDLDEEGRVIVVIDGALSEARQQSVALMQILTKLGAGKLEAVKPKTVSVLDAIADELAGRRRERETVGESVAEDPVGS